MAADVPLGTTAYPAGVTARTVPPAGTSAKLYVPAADVVADGSPWSRTPSLS